jgi:release factor glutamine methyltransferase
VLGRPRAWLYAWPEHLPTPEQCAAFERAIAERARGVPVAYLLGHRAFWTFDLAVTPAVLIPRPETERLVELALARLPQEQALAVADLGTGSGAVALAIASERAHARVLATDIAPDALAVARSNAARLGITNIAFAEGDWCAALGDAHFDLIASNPPYIEECDPHLGEGDLRHEPAHALSSGADGLDAIRAIVDAAPRHLLPGSWLMLEHGRDQAARVRDLLAARGFVDVGSARDLAGHERVSLGRLPSER